MSLELLANMSPGQACVVSDMGKHEGRTALHMAVWSKPKDTAEDVYAEFLQMLCRKASGKQMFSFRPLLVFNPFLQG